jgi:hypothetical protein
MTVAIRRRGLRPGRRELSKGLKYQRWSGNFLRLIVFFGSKLLLFPFWQGPGFDECFFIDFGDH